MSDTVPLVLVVDIEPETHLVTDRAMPETECVIAGARTAEMALKLAERRAPTVLVVDEHVGGMGYLIDKLRIATPHLRVIVLVAPDHAMQAATGRLHTIGSILRKPLEVGRFRSTVRMVLRISAMSAGVHRMHDADPGTGPTPTPVPRRYLKEK